MRGKRQAAGSGRGDPFADDIPYQRTRRPKKRKKRGGLVLGFVLVAGLGAFLVWNFFIKKPDVSHNDKPGVTNNNPNEPFGGGSAAGTADAPGGRKEDYFTFLLLGRDTAGGGTDTIILVSYDVPNQQVNMMSIPRDTAINVPWSVKKINSVYSAKESSGGGLENLKKQVAYLTGVMPDFYVTIEWKAVGKVVEAVGGVEFDVPRNMNYDDPYQDLHIHLNKGVQKLNGQKAMEMLRYRHDNDASVGYNDTGRMDTQKAFLKAMAKEVLKLKNMTKIGEFINIFMENVTTDLKLSDLTWFASKALGVDTETIQSSTMPYYDVGTFHGGYYLLPNAEEIVPLINEQFNPYNREITQDDLQVLVRRDDGSCYVPGGTLLDAKWGKSQSGSRTVTTGGGISTEKPTGVTAAPVTEPSGGGSGGSQAADEPAQTAKPSDKPVEGETGTPPDNTAGEPGGEDEPVLPDPIESGEGEPGSIEDDPVITITPEPEPDTDTVPDTTQTTVPDTEQEPELPPEPVLPPDDMGMNAA